MKLRNVFRWTRFVCINADHPYSWAVITYARQWAELMEKEMDRGKRLEGIAKRTSHEADTNGIIGYMYGAAVSMLAQVWHYGEDLRRWHNIDTQIGDEGERANANGGTLNPALLNIGAAS